MQLKSLLIFVHKHLPVCGLSTKNGASKRAVNVSLYHVYVRMSRPYDKRVYVTS